MSELYQTHTKVKVHIHKMCFNFLTFKFTSGRFFLGHTKVRFVWKKYCNICPIITQKTKVLAFFKERCTYTINPK